ncbi:hypothetical protein UY3_17278 [Chelonia mydas]|uniref:Uncharacterized protein n=1 Tax=Chelonia mydas TaxID=8469 RepID=M7AMF4_CHEMY|nr:hypothetical protein UY3_17278 [Chelonia mydas]
MEEDFVEEEEEENEQQASGESILPGSQDLFITLEPIPSQDGIPDPEGREGTSEAILYIRSSVSPLKIVNLSECVHITKPSIECWSSALWVAIPQFLQSLLRIGILG